jgi:hypothetical protein
MSGKFVVILITCMIVAMLVIRPYGKDKHR